MGILGESTKRKTEEPGSTAILVMSCDAYADVWDGFSKCIEEYWPDCPYPIYISSETIPAPKGMIFERTLFSTAEDWGGRLKESLEQMKEDRVFFVLDDMWLCRPVCTDSIIKAGALLRNSDVGVVRLTVDSVKKTVYSGNPDYMEITFGEPYRVSTAPSIWDKRFLLSVLKTPESAWEFERVGSFRESGKSQRVLGVRDALYTFIGDAGAVSRGAYDQSAVAFAKAHGIMIDLEKRKVKAKKDYVISGIKSLIYSLCPKGVVKIQNRLYHLRNK